MDVCVVGLGAVGVFYAYLLQKSGKARVTAVCRSNYDILSGPGIRFRSSDLEVDEPGWKPYRAVRTCSEAADRDYHFVICCFKALPDVITTPKLIEPLLSKSSTFVLIQNGIGIEHDLQQAGPSACIISACAWIDSTTLDEGRTVSQTGLPRLTTGIYKSSARTSSEDLAVDSASLQLLGDLLRAGGGKVTETSNIEAARWKKVLWNASLSTICTLTRCNVATLMKESTADATVTNVRAIMAEVLQVAHRSGITSPELTDAVAESIIQDTKDRCGHSNPEPSQFRPSMLVDLENSRPLEVEVIVGGIVRAAQAVDVKTPRLSLIYASLRVIQSTLL